MKAPRLGEPSLSNEIVALDELRVDPDNAAEHSPENIEVLDRSLRRNQQYKPIVVDAGEHDPERRGVVRAGNCLLDRMAKAGYTHAWVVWKAFQSELEAKAFAIADNMAGRRHSWDWEVYAKRLDEFAAAGLEGLDYGVPEVASDTWAPPPVDEDFDPEVKSEWTRYEVDVEKADVVDEAIALFGGNAAQALPEICRIWLDLNAEGDE